MLVPPYFKPLDECVAYTQEDADGLSPAAVCTHAKFLYKEK